MSDFRAAAQLLELADKIIGMEFYAFKFEDKPTKLCIRRVGEDVFPMTKEECEKLTDELNAAILPIIDRTANNIAERAKKLLEPN